MLTFAPSLKFHCKMKLFEFAQRFPDEASCESYLKAQREKSGIVCKKCGCRKNCKFGNTLSISYFIQ